jgi:hypothetical protein
MRAFKPNGTTGVRRIFGSVAALAAACSSPWAHAEDAAALAKKLSNPVASLISVPFQNNYDRRIGPADDGERNVLNIQPVYPVTLDSEWNLISRTIVPVVYQNEIFPGSGSQFGLGDVVQSLFLSPQKPTASGVIWGAGPVFLIPTGTEPLLSARKWGAGPTGVVLKQEGRWSFGMLANHIWSFAGRDERADVSATFLQPFVAHTSADAWTVSLNTESTYNWEDEDWSVPINFNVSKLLKFGNQPVQIGGGLRYWVESPDAGPKGLGFRLSVTFLFPR